MEQSNLEVNAKAKEEFESKKQQYLSEKHVLDNLIKEKEKIKNIIQALKQEFTEQANKAKAKIGQSSFLSADEYVALKQEETGIKTRIEYYNAYLEELEAKIYQQKEVLYSYLSQATESRKALFFTEFKALLNTFSEVEKETLNKLYFFIKYSGKVTANNLIDGYKGSLEYASKKYLATHILDLLNDEIVLDDKFSLPIFVHSSELKTSAQKHLEQFNTKKTGFEKLADTLFQE